MVRGLEIDVTPIQTRTAYSVNKSSNKIRCRKEMINNNYNI